ncbi:MAG: LysR family transcriptional regulator [Actinomycetota bacterium]|jgi:DNA-binding transcriptional LysR family regulator|nr:LysR family transcriptional regulator [Actinomycetota bacterium]
MDLRQLTTLIAIADHGSFSAAARSLYTVQSNVSGHVARLERELGVVLVDRANGRMTEHGDRVLERARRIMHELEDIVSDIRSREHDIAGDVRIGVIGTVARWVMPPLLASVAARHPSVHTIVSEGSSSALVPNVASGLLNGAIVHLPVDEPDMTVVPFFDEELLLMAPLDHELANEQRIAISDLHRRPLLLPPGGAALRRILDRSAAENGITLIPQTEVDGVRLLASLARDGHGAAIVPATALRAETSSDVVMIPVDGLPRRRVAWVRRRRPNPTPATEAVFDCLQSTVADNLQHQIGLHPPV